MIDSTALQKLIPINTLSPDGIEALAQGLSVHEYADGDYIYRLGQEIHDLFYVIDGCVQIMDIESRALETLKYDDPRASMPFTHEVPTTGAAVAVEGGARVLRVDSRLFNSILAWDQDTAPGLAAPPELPVDKASDIEALHGSYAPSGPGTQPEQAPETKPEPESGPAPADKPNSSPAPESTLKSAPEPEVGTQDWMTGFLRARGFQMVPPRNLQAVFFKMEEITVEPDEVIIRQGATDNDYFYVIAQGRVDVLRESEQLGKSVSLAVFGPGACFGEDALISGNPRNATVIARKACTLMRMHRDDFNKLLRTPLTRKLDPAEAQEKIGSGAEWVDVRMPPQASRKPVQGSIRVPFPLIRSRLAGFDADKTFVVVCEDGRDSSVAAFLMAKQGLDVYFLHKGLANWHPDDD